MRTVTFPLLVALGLAGLNTARAADLDYDYLRGAEYDPAPVVAAVDWSGLYLGGHGGFSSTSLGFGNSAQPIIADYLRQTTVETEGHVSTLLSSHSSQRVNGGTYGAFAGFNVQFDALVLGIEADYTHSGLGGSYSDAIARSLVTSDGYYNRVGLTGLSQTRVDDYATVRARAGYAIGSFLPFVTGGVAIGSALVRDRVTVQSAGYDQTTYKANQAITDGSRAATVGHYGYSTFDQAYPGSAVLADPYVYARTKNKIVGGFAGGAGIEYAITPNFTLRAEYQYVLFDAFDGHKVNVNTLRGGAAVKF